MGKGLSSGNSAGKRGTVKKATAGGTSRKGSKPPSTAAGSTVKKANPNGRRDAAGKF